MNKLYSVHDHWTDINKKNDIDIESIDGVISGIKVNGEDYGGESDLSIATLRFINGSATVLGAIALDTDSQSAGSFSVGSLEEETLKIILYKGSAMIQIDRTVESTSGNIENLGTDGYRVTGDCTVTVGD